MQVKEIMTHGVTCARPDDSLTAVAQKMRDLNIGALPVCGDHDRLAGMVTDRDITVRATADGRTPAATRVRDVMTPEIVYCLEDQDVRDAARLMKDKQIRRLAVLNQEKRLVGMVSLGDLAVETGDDKLAGNTLEDVSQPATPPP